MERKKELFLDFHNPHYFLYTSLTFWSCSLKKHEPRGQWVPLIIEKANVPLVQTKDNIPQRLPNVRVDVEMIENAFLVYQFQLSRRTLQPTLQTTSFFRGGNSFRGESRPSVFIGIFTGNFVEPRHVYTFCECASAITENARVSNSLRDARSYVSITDRESRDRTPGSSPKLPLNFLACS